MSRSVVSLASCFSLLTVTAAIAEGVTSPWLADPLSTYTKFQRTVLPWLTPLAHVEGDVASIAAACSNSSAAAAAAASLVPCTWSPMLSDKYLPHCAAPPGETLRVNCIHFPTLAQAQAACAADVHCGGVTDQDGGVPPWELRGGPSPLPSGLGERSYVITNPQACHGTPPPPVPPGCNAFTTDGTLYSCPGGRCDCDAGVDVCARGRDIFSIDPAVGMGAADTDLYVRSGRAPPPEWEAAIAAGTLLYASPEPSTCYWPEVGNGFLATVPGWGSLHVGGLYNGHCGDTTKARFPSPAALSIDGGTAVAGGLDTLRGFFTRRWVLADGATEVEVRTWAHRTRKHVLVVDVSLVAGSYAAMNVTSLWDPAAPTDVPGNGCAGRFSVDLAFGAPEGSAPAVFSGATVRASDAGEVPNVTVALDIVPPTIILSPSTPRVRFLTAVATSIDFPGGAGSVADVAALARAEYASAASLSWDALLQEHVSAWAVLNLAGIDIAPASDDPADVAFAADIESHARASTYYLFSSLRDDHPHGISPGGLASQNYQGAIFMDADWWAEPALLFLSPPLAASILQYRFNTLPVMTHLATVFGFDAFGGAMSAWTAAYLGNPFGCCDAHGEYEDCLEHHISGDIAFSAWQYFSSTGNATWLATVGFQLLSAIANYHLARVSPLPPNSAELINDTAVFHVHGVLPIDEVSDAHINDTAAFTLLH